MTDPPLTVYSTWWCQYCMMLKLRLRIARIAYTNYDVDSDPDAAAFCMAANGGNRTVPTVRFADGSTLTNPTMAAIRTKLAEQSDTQS